MGRKPFEPEGTSGWLTMTYRVAWLIPVRNGRRWLQAAVESALAECTGKDHVVVVDDGSRDGSGDVARALGVTVIATPPPRQQGIVGALELGRRHCRSEYVARLDADDVALPGRINAQVEFLEQRSECAVVGGRAALEFDAKVAPEGMMRYVDWVNRQQDPHRELLVESPLFHPAVLMRASAVEAVGGYQWGNYPEDYDLWLRLAAYGFRLANLERKVVVLRDHPVRLTRSDPRYSRAGFDTCRQRYLADTHLPAHRPQRVVLWSGPSGGRPWLRWLLQLGHDVQAIIDLKAAPDRSGIQVLSPQALKDLEFDYLLVAVGKRGARELIRAEIAKQRPELVEGETWFALL